LEILKTIAIYRFINPKISIRYAGGRSLLREYAKKGLSAGINSALTGNYLTTTGSTIESDKEMAREAGFEIR
jgi:biotin synthase